MNKIKTTAMTFAATAVSVAMASPSPRIVADSVTMVQPESTRVVTITYKLADAPAIVTLDIETNAVPNASTGWVSIGEENVTHVTGDANRPITGYSAEGTTHTIHWRPDKSWPDHQISDGCARAVVKAWDLSAPPPYRVSDLEAQGNVFYYTSARAIPGGITNDAYKTTKMLMRLVPAAEGITWRMGAPLSEVGNLGDNRPDYKETAHYVSFTKDYYLGVYEVTRKQYYLVMGGKTAPAEADEKLPQNYCNMTVLRGDWLTDGVSWPDTSFTVKSGSVIDKFRTALGSDRVDLPTEAQWEYACRAGTSGSFYNGAVCETDGNWYTFKCDAATNIAWFAKCSGNVMHPVGQLEPNDWDLYDMCGNVNEWCLDVYAKDLGSATVEDPIGVSATPVGAYPERSVRGGSYSSGPADCRAAKRYNGFADNSTSANTSGKTGFRLAIHLQ